MIPLRVIEYHCLNGSFFDVIRLPPHAPMSTDYHSRQCRFNLDKVSIVLEAKQVSTTYFKIKTIINKNS